MRMNKAMVIMLIALFVLFGGITAYKAVMGILVKNYISNSMKSAKISVSAVKIGYSEWQPHIRSTGSVRAINGVNVTTELAGMVQQIYFTPGSYVLSGKKLVQLNADAEIGQLQSLQAQLQLAKITYERDKAQYAIHAVSLQQLQSDEQNMRSLQGQLATQTATVKKKSIIAPFSGRLGINYVNLGQFINPGDKIASLQQLDPIYVDFTVPQQFIGTIKQNQKVTITMDNNYPNKVFTGKITALDANVDPVSRNITVEATIPNPDKQLVPGAFGIVEVSVGDKQRYLTLPQTAISYNPYGDLVYVVTEKGKDKEGKPLLFANQVIVTLGDTRGDQVAVLKGVKEGDLIVTSGQVKLRNGAAVIINNSMPPADNPNPRLPNEY